MSPKEAFRQAHSEARHDARALLECIATTYSRARITAAWNWRGARCSVLVTRNYDTGRSPDQQIADARACFRAEYARTIWNAGDARISATLYRAPAVHAEHKARARRLLQRAKENRCPFPLPA